MATNYANILAGAKALHNPPEKYGAIVPTDVAAGFMNQWMETFSIANGLHPVKSDGSSITPFITTWILPTL